MLWGFVLMAAASQVSISAAPPTILHPFPDGAGDVDGPFYFQERFHLFSCCQWDHVQSTTAVGPWNRVVGTGIGKGYISGSTTIVNGIPRIVAPLNRGNNDHCCVGPPSNGRWKYPCVANPPTAACYQTYQMSFPTNLSDCLLSDWDQPSEATHLLRNYSDGHPSHGWVQQDPSLGFQIDGDSNSGRWYFVGGTSINGTEANPAGVPIIELFGSRPDPQGEYDDWSLGFDYLGIFSADGLQMCDPELIRWPNTTVAALYVCTSQYLLGHVVPTINGYRFDKLAGTGAMPFEAGGGAAKGYWHAASGRYLLWLHHAKGFTLTHEVTLDAALKILLINPAREYRGLRVAPPLVSLSNVSVATAAAALSAAGPKMGSALDIELLCHLEDETVGECGVTVLGGTSVVITMHNTSSATLSVSVKDDGSPKTMALPLTPGDTTLDLRVIVDGVILETFALGGRAQVLAAVTGPPSHEVGIAKASKIVDVSVSTLAYQ